MKRLLLAAAAALSFTSIALADAAPEAPAPVPTRPATMSDADTACMNRLAGTWEVHLDTNEGGVQMSIHQVGTYDANGTFTVNINVTSAGQAQPPMAMAGEWWATGTENPDVCNGTVVFNGQSDTGVLTFTDNNTVVDEEGISSTRVVQ